MCFPVIAWLMTLAESSRPLTLSGVVDLHLESNLFYIIDMAPFVIGVLFFVIGKYSLVKLRYLKRLSAFERDLRETQETPMQKMALRKIRVQYIKTFLAAGSTLVAILIMLLIHFNHSNTVNKQLSGVCESIAGQLSSLDINSPEVAAQIEVSRVQFSSLVASQAQWSNTAILVCRNTASMSDAMKAQAILGELSKLEPEEVKNHFRSSLGKATLSERGGAGLGLIDITYRSGEVPDFEIIPHENPELCNYAIRTKLNIA